MLDVTQLISLLLVFLTVECVEWLWVIRKIIVMRLLCFLLMDT